MTHAATTTSFSAARGAPAAAPVVVCERLTKVFRDFWLRPRAKAVNAVSFEIRRGEVFGLLGPNGSGKSTTIKIILGLLHKTSGLVSVFGKLPTDVSIKQRIGYLPEESYLYPFLNARETLDYYGRLFQLDRAVRKRRIDELLDMVGLGGAQFRPVREYSKGMQRRIGIAQALINDPEFLILDEPTTGLDPLGTRQIKDLIIALGRRGKTILLSSHLLSDVEDCVDRMVILYGGRIQREGTCDALLETQDATVLETDPLDEATISAIDRLIRERSGGARSLVRVARPRQKLEDLFVQIVDEARAAQQETSGAQHGGRTAAFLAGDEGDGLISSLVEAGRREELPRAEATPAAESPAGPDRDVLADLLKPEAPAPTPAAVAPAPAAPPRSSADVDLSVIEGLVDQPSRPTEPGKGSNP
ncbi:MAG: ABC transporter ATP-binding protein [Phycisphaeraceae bacterium]|nr:ABC transporter ATP-binding protein [Phycisphaeraceae bacterium]